MSDNIANFMQYLYERTIDTTKTKNKTVYDVVSTEPGEKKRYYR